MPSYMMDAKADQKVHGKDIGWTRVTHGFLPCDDLTAFDIAESLGYTELLVLLIPVILHHLPPEIVWLFGTDCRHWLSSY